MGLGGYLAVQPWHGGLSWVETRSSSGATGELWTSNASISARESSRTAGGSPVIRRQRSTNTAAGSSANDSALEVRPFSSVGADVPIRPERAQPSYGPFVCRRW
jgi:hypothetical protein